MCDPFDMPDCQLWSDKRSKVVLEERKGRKYFGKMTKKNSSPILNWTVVCWIVAN